MSLSAWLMLVFAVLVLGGGLTVCLIIAHRSDSRKEAAGVRYGDGDA